MTENKDIKKHFVIDIEYINDLAVNIAENVPEQYYYLFCKELYEYLKCAINNELYHNENGELPPEDKDADYSTEDDLSSDSGSDLAEEEYVVSKTEDGFYELSDCDVKDCNAVGKEEIKSIE